ncbi:AAA family ATPase [Thalassobaculum salexigens]|uniref:bifunctional aminoglycoside phosphotransferase/ATP-binding protein n=1 Tax=Thalassobaculum salexigens TaxID=455360 RepID=UPI00248F270B|nr:bifunctional aminoglycoside phosphotransferase/ATP-binding protein [Thalassobaculum salexigens]
MATASHVVEDQSAVFDFLADPVTHAGADDVHRIDTHGAAVFLAGDDAYKVKRAVKFPFMDFSTLDKRKTTCEAEIAVNRPNAPDIYLGAVPITRDGNGLAIDGDGEPVEWCVHMRRFDVDMTLDRIAERDDLSDDLLRRTAAAIAASHQRAALREGTGFAKALAEIVRSNGSSLAEAPEVFDDFRAENLIRRSQSALKSVTSALDARERQGRVRRCHGDLHLRNIVLLGDEPTLFDAIEFDEDLATTDVLYDLAFLLMDLGQRGLTREANLILNRYLAEDRDPNQIAGLAAMPLFVSVRAVIRAKVIAASVENAPQDKKSGLIAEAQRYFDFAEAVLVPYPPRLVAVGGLSGTGKSTLAAHLAGDLTPFPGALHLRSDVIRKRLMGVGEHEKLGDDGYTEAVTRQVYDTLLQETASALRAGQSVVVDAVNQRLEEREALADLASEMDVDFTGLWLEAPTETLVARADNRDRDASDADGAVVVSQAERDLGYLDWYRIDAGGGPEQTLQAARAAVGIS